MSEKSSNPAVSAADNEDMKNYGRRWSDWGARFGLWLAMLFTCAWIVVEFTRLLLRTA